MSAIASLGEDSITRTIEVEKEVDLGSRSIDDSFEFAKSVEWVKNNGYERVALQFPNELLKYAAQVVTKIGELISPSRAYILADSTYGSCCVDEKTAAHINADSVIHYGHYCGSAKAIKMPVLYIHVRPEVDMERLALDFRSTFNEDETVGILYDYEYQDIAETLAKKLNRPQVALLSPERIELSLCDSDTTSDSSTVNIPSKCFYLTSTQSAVINRVVQLNKITSSTEGGGCQISIYDPIASKTLTTPAIHRLLMKRNYYIEKLREAGTIGILVGTLSVDNFLGIISHLKTIIRRANKRVFVVSIGEISAPKLANFPDIHAYVLVACPETTLIESKEFFQVVATPWEVEVAFGRENLTADYFVDYRVLLPGAKEYMPFEKYTTTACADVSLLNGVSRIDLNWQGLEERIQNEQSEVKVHEGQSGIARHYVSEPAV